MLCVAKLGSREVVESNLKPGDTAAVTGNETLQDQALVLVKQSAISGLLAACTCEGRVHGTEAIASRNPGRWSGTSLTRAFWRLAQTSYPRAWCAAPRAHRPVLSGRRDQRGVRGRRLSSGDLE